MRQAAEYLYTKAAMQIRYLETLKQVGRSNTKVIFVPELKNKERVNHLITQGLIN
jgi:regulator of protease activity HflC (stomatin/prohibitin superfamily)